MMSRVVGYLFPAASALGLPLLALSPPQTGGPVFVIAAPWSEAAGAVGLVSRAEGRVLRGTALPWVVVAVSDEPRFSARLREAGAWLIVDAGSVSGCPKPSDPRGPR